MYRLLVIIMLIGFAGSGLAQELPSLNGKELGNNEEDFSFIVSGHFHGSSSSRSGYPASTLLANIDTVNAMTPAFIVSTGDLFLDVNEQYILNYKRSLFDKLAMPFYNAVGNHDLANGNLYEKVYGKTYYAFNYGNSCFVVLNTELDDGSITGKQFEFLKSEIAKASKGNCSNVFIFSHRPVWAENDSMFSGLFENNTRTEIGNNNYWGTVHPEFSVISDKRIFWISGSLGGGPASFFYQPYRGVTFMQTAIRDEERDALLKVNIRQGKVSFEGVSLTGQKLMKIEEYDVAFWREHLGKEEPFNYRLLPYLVKKTVLHHYFWIGFSVSLLFVFLFRIVYRTWQKRK